MKTKLISITKGETLIDVIADAISEYKDSAMQLISIMEEIGSAKKKVQSLMDQNKNGKEECDMVKQVIWEQCDSTDVGLTESLQAIAFALGSIASMQLVERFI